MATRIEITKKYSKAYVGASKAQKGRILDAVVEMTGWDRDHARQQLRRRASAPPGKLQATVVVIDRRRSKPKGYSYDAIKVLQRVWSVTGGICGKYLAASMGQWIQAMEAAGDLVPGQGRYSECVRAELLAMSAATIDRYLAPVRAQDRLRGKSTTKPGALLRNSISIRKAGDEVEAEPGFFEVDTVAHCGPSLKGEFIRSVNFTDMHTGWVFTTAIRNNATVHMMGAFGRFIDQVPFAVSGIDCDNGSEFINHELIGWAGQAKIFFTRSRPYKKNDQATIESKNNHLVRRYGFYYRYDTPEELTLLNELWALVCDRLNFFTPTKKPTGYATDKIGRRKRLYDAPQSPYQRLLQAGVLSPAQQAELAQYKDTLSPVAIADQIDAIQARLIALAAQKTRELERQALRDLPDPRGIKIRTPKAS